jgi:hypothetical protein
LPCGEVVARELYVAVDGLGFYPGTKLDVVKTMNDLSLLEAKKKPFSLHENPHHLFGLEWPYRVFEVVSDTARRTKRDPAAYEATCIRPVREVPQVELLGPNHQRVEELMRWYGQLNRRQLLATTAVPSLGDSAVPGASEARLEVYNALRENGLIGASALAQSILKRSTGRASLLKSVRDRIDLEVVKENISFATYELLGNGYKDPFVSEAMGTRLGT